MRFSYLFLFYFTFVFISPVYAQEVVALDSDYSKLPSNELLAKELTHLEEDIKNANQVTHKYGLSELFSYAKEKDATLLAAQARLEEKYAEKGIARSNLLPRMDAGAGLSKIDHTLLNYGSIAKKQGLYSAYNYSVTLAQPLFDGESWYGLKSADMRIQSAVADVLYAEQNLIQRLAEAYFNVIMAYNTEDVTRKERDRLIEVLKEAETKFRERTTDVVSVYEAKAALDAQEAKLVKATGERENLESELGRISGIRISASQIKAISSFEPIAPEPSEVSPWITYTLENHPTLIKARNELSVAENEVKRAYAGYLPTAQLYTSYSVKKGDAFLSELETEDYTYGVSLKFPVFEGFRTKSTVSAHVAMRKEASQNLKAYEDDLSKKTEIALSNVYANQRLYAALKKQLESALVQLKGVRKGRAIGTRTQTDLINAEQAYFKAEVELKNALCGDLILSIRLKAASGCLSVDEIVKLDKLLAD